MERVLHIKITAKNGQTIPEDIYRNLYTLFGSWKGEMETDRNYGLSRDIIDLPVPEARRVATLEIMEQVGTYEPRAHIIRVDADGANANGILEITVVITWEA